MKITLITVLSFCWLCNPMHAQWTVGINASAQTGSLVGSATVRQVPSELLDTTHSFSNLKQKDLCALPALFIERDLSSDLGFRFECSYQSTAGYSTTVPYILTSLVHLPSGEDVEV